MAVKRNLLIVEDDENIRSMLRMYFEPEGYNVFEAETGTDAIRLFSQEQIDLVFLDIMLPEMDGLQVCEKLREHSDVAVIMITAKSQEEDKLRGFSYGADEYITKPFSLKVLAARAENLMRRIDGRMAANTREVYGRISFDPAQQKVSVDGTPILLTKKEYDVFALLVRNRGIILSKQQLLDRVWGVEYDGDPRTLDTCVSRLRKKLGTQSSSIQTLPGRGYCFQPNEDSAL